MTRDDDRTQRPPPCPGNADPAVGGDAAGPDTRANDTSSGLQMPPDLMLDLARQATELLMGRIQELPDDTAWDGEFRQELLDQLMEDPPEEGRPGAEVLERAARDVLPLTLRLDHPRSFAFVPTAPTWPGVIADFIAAGYNINACTWLVASGPSQLELVVIDWIRRWLGYPEGAGGLFTSGGSAASLDAFVAAREAAGHPERGTVYMSDQSHSSFLRAAIIAGIRRECVRKVPTDRQFRLDVNALAEAVARDRADGFNPVAICANAGTASTGSVDPLGEMADYCASEGIWLHVDAAYGGFAVVTEAGKRLLAGIERADSIGLDAHKWLFQPYEAGCLLVKDVRTLENAFGVHHDVLQDTIWGADHPNFADRGLQLSRSFRALKVWMSIQTFGMAAFREAVENGMELAARAEDYVRSSPVLQVVNPASLGIVCFRVNPEDAELDDATLEELNRKVLAQIFWDDTAFISSTSLHGKFSLRLCIINHNTTWKDVRETLQAVERFGAAALRDRGSDQAT